MSEPPATSTEDERDRPETATGDRQPAGPQAGRIGPERPLETRALPAPRVDAVSAALRHPLLVLLPMLLLAAGAYALAGRQPTTFTAEAEVLMQQPAPTNAAALPGVVQAELSLAPVYARELDFDPVVVPIARRLHMTPGAVAGALSATPIPSSPIIRIDASAGSSALAVSLANAAAARLAAFVTSQADSATTAGAVLARYRLASAALQSALAHRRRVASVHGPGSPAVLRAAAAASVAQLRVSALASEYQAATGQGPTSPTLGVFARAGAASSNHRSTLETYLFAGAVAGLVIGVALATLVANRRRLRANPSS